MILIDKAFQETRTKSRDKDSPSTWDYLTNDTSRLDNDDQF